MEAFAVHAHLLNILLLEVLVYGLPLAGIAQVNPGDDVVALLCHSPQLAILYNGMLEIVLGHVLKDMFAKVAHLLQIALA